MDKKIQLSTNVDDEVVNVFPVTKPEFVEFNDGKTLVDKMNNLESSNGLLAATPSKDGLMSKEDKAKLDNVQNYVHPVTHEATMITQDSEHRFITDNERIAWNNKADGSIATSTNAGLMSAADKQKIDGLSAEFKTRDDKINKNTEDIKSWNDEMINKEYKDFSGKDITIENSIVSKTTDMVIKGRTLQNISPNGISDCSDVSAFNHSYQDVKLEKGDGFVKCTQPLAYRYNILGYDNHTLKPLTNYIHIADVEILNNPSNEDCRLHLGSFDRKKEQTIKQGRGIIVAIGATLDNVTNGNNAWIGIRLGTDESDGAGNSFKAYNIASYEITEEEVDKDIDELLEKYPVNCDGIKSFGEQENKISILSTGKNLFDGKSTSWFWEGAVGTKIPNNDINATQYSIIVPVKKGLQYSFSGYSNIPPLSQRTSVYFTDINKIIIKTGQTTDNIVAPEDGFVYWYACSEDIKPYLKYLQVEEGTQATQYEPYKCDKKDILLQNLGFDEGLRGLNNSVYDELNNIENVVIKRIEKYVFTGNEDISIIDERTETISFKYFNDTHITSWNNPSNLLCTTLPSIGDKIYDSDNVGCSSDMVGFIFRLNKNSLTSQNVEGFKEWLKANPTTIYYKLAEPIETSLSENINLKTFEERTYVSSDNIIKGDLNLKVPMNTAANLENNSSRLNTVEDYIDTNKNNIDKISKLEEGAVTSSLNIIDLQKEIKNDNDYTHYEGTNVDIDNLSKDSRTTNMIIKGQTLQNIFPTDPQKLLLKYANIEGSTITMNPIAGVWANAFDSNNSLWKTNTKYTVIIDIIENTLIKTENSVPGALIVGNETNESVFDSFQLLSIDTDNNVLGVYKKVLTSQKSFDSLSINQGARIFLTNTYNGGQLKFKVMILEGDWTDKIIPSYFEGVKSFGESEGNKISISSTGKNLFDESKSEYGLVSVDNGQVMETDESKTTDYIKVQKGKEYVIKAKGQIRSWYCVFYDNNKNFIKQHSMSIDSPSTFEDDGYFRFSYASDKTTMNETPATNIMFIENIYSNCEYEPYKEYKKDIIIKEPLRSIDNVQDIIYEDNGQIKVCRNIGNYIFTGNEPWEYGGESSNKNICLYLPKSNLSDLIPNCNFDIEPNNNKNVICNNLKSISRADLSDTNMLQKNNCISINSNGINLNISSLDSYDGSSKDVEKAKEWLKANPTTIVYQLAEPTTEVLENCVDTNLKVYNEKTYIDCLNTIKGELSFDIPNNLVTQVKDNTININKNYDSIKSLNDKTSNLQSAQVSTALNVLELQKHTAMLSNGEINDYENYSGLYVECNNTLDSRTEDMRIKGKTLLNIHSKSNYSFATSIPQENYTLSEGQNFCEVTIKKYQSGCYYYINAGKINFDLLKPNQKYTLLAKATDGLYPSIMTGGYEFPLTSGGTHFKNGVATMTTNNLVDGSKGQILYINLNGGETYKQEIRDVMIFEGDLSIVPCNYFEGIKSFGEEEREEDKYKISILSHGKNLLDFNKINKNMPWDSNGNQNNIVLNDGLRIFRCSSNHYPQQTLIYLEKGSYYITKKITPSRSDLKNRVLMYFYKKNDKNSMQVGDTSILINESGFYHVGLEAEGLINNGDYFEVRDIGLFSQDIPYESYKEDKKDIIIKEPLRSIGNVQDVMCEDNGQVKIDRNIGNYIFTGNESIKTFELTDETTELGFEFLDFELGFEPVNNNYPNAISNRFKVYSTVYSGSSYEGIALNQNGNTYIRISKDKLSTPDINGIKAWLKANPTTIVYQLAEPTVEIVESIDINVDTYKNKTYITTDNNIKGVLELQTQNNFGAIMKNVNRCISKIFNSFNNIINKKGE